MQINYIENNRLPEFKRRWKKNEAKWKYKKRIAQEKISTFIKKKY